MRTSYVKNGLVVVVILLFIGVAVQSSIAVNPISSDNKENCDICPKVNKTHLIRLKSLINRVETLNNELSVVSKYNLEVEEKYQKLSDKITALTEMNKELKSGTPHGNNPIICIFLWKLINFFISIFIPLENLFDELLVNNHLILYCTIVLLTIPISITYIIIADLFVIVFDCMY